MRLPLDATFTGSPLHILFSNSGFPLIFEWPTSIVVSNVCEPRW
uniref:Uncharacterized protein n=1 Tax=Arundo donax TaxID=35708 RepID=A0A0A9HUE6_ARUDO